MSQDYTELDYAGLQAACKERDLKASGTKEELLARLQEADAAGNGDEGDTNTETGGDTGEGEGNDEGAGDTNEEEKPAPTAAKKAVSEAQVAKAHTTDQQKMKAHLDAQPKIKVMIPFDAGVDARVAKKIPFVVNLNGYRYEIPRGVFVDVPQQIAEVVMERLESEGKIGEEYRLDRDPAKQQALG